MKRTSVLVIDDEQDLLELVRYNLAREGFTVREATDGLAGIESAKREIPDLIILDLMMPGMSGLEVCKQLRADEKTAGVAVIMLTAKAAETDRVIGLELGADDYITKPFSPRELVARVRAVLRRTADRETPTKQIRRGDLTVDTEKREVKYAGADIALTATEFRILEFLAGRAGRVMSRDQIINAAVGNDRSVFDRTIDVHITSLRKKLGAGGDLIETVRGFGYKFKE